MNEYANLKKAELISLLRDADRQAGKFRSNEILSIARMGDSREVCEKLRATIKELTEECAEKDETVIHLRQTRDLLQTSLRKADESVKNLKSTNDHLTNDYEQARDLASNREKMLLDFELQMEALKTIISTSLNHYSLNSEVEDSPHWAGFRSL